MPMAAKNYYAGCRDINQYRADITDVDTIDNVFSIERPNVIIHAAAQTVADKPFTTTNVLGTKILLDTSVKYGVKRFIYVSSDSVYGSLNSESEPSWDENSPLNPQNTYSLSKVEAEKLVKVSGLQYNITRSSNNYGERQQSNRLIPRVVKSILDGDKIPIYDKGDYVRDWIYVQDNCRGILSVLKRGAPNEIYNIGANNEMSVVEMAQRVCKILGRGYDLIEHVPNPREGVSSFRRSMDCSKIKGLGWTTEFKLGDGLEQTCRWYEKNRYWALNGQ